MQSCDRHLKNLKPNKQEKIVLADNCIVKYLVNRRK